MKLQISRYGRYGIAVLALMAISTAVGGYIVIKQHLKLPLQSRYTVKAEFETSNGLTPGLAQPVNVAGVRVGQITDAELRDGRSIVTLEIDPGKLPHVYADARADLVPNTPLKDMQVELTPGRPPAKELGKDDMIPLKSTSPTPDSDELTAALDGDSRLFFQALIGGVDRGVAGRGKDLRELFKTLGPTSEQVRRVGDALAARRHEMKRLVHNLSILAAAAGSKDKELAQVISNSNNTIQALASQEAALRGAVHRLPGTLSAARTSLGKAAGFANELTPTLQALMPTAHNLKSTLQQAAPFISESATQIRTQVRPLIHDNLPLVAGRGHIGRQFKALTPVLGTIYQVLEYVGNEAAYNPPGSNEGFLFWTSWFAHNGASMLSAQDAHGAMWRGLNIFSCNQLKDQPPQLSAVLTAILGPLPGCGG
jgi:phospholipid/cholesterol/gamma-HCH transport system substrate-binding protein